MTHPMQEGVLAWKLSTGLLRLLVDEGVLSQPQAFGLCERLARELQKEWRSGMIGIGEIMHVLAEEYQGPAGV